MGSTRCKHTLLYYPDGAECSCGGWVMPRQGAHPATMRKLWYEGHRKHVVQVILAEAEAREALET